MEQTGDMGLGQKAVDFLSASFRGYNIQLEARAGITEGIQMQSGLPQGHVLPHFLFNLFLNGLLVRLGAITQEALGSTQSLAYANDIVLLRVSVECLQRMIDVVHNWWSLFSPNVQFVARGKLLG